MIGLLTISERISQLQAWKLWFDNADISNNTLIFDITVHNWGRIGKCLQALAAFTVLLDIIGAPAVRGFGSRLRSITTFAKAKRLTVRGLQLFAYMLTKGIPEALFRLDSIIRHTRKLIISVETYCSRGTGRETRSTLLLKTYRRTIPAILNSRKGIRRRNRWRARVFPESTKYDQFQKRVLNFTLHKIFWVWLILAICIFIYRIYCDGPAKGLVAAYYRSVLALIFVFSGFGLLIMVIEIGPPVLMLVTALFAIVIDSVFVEPVAWVIGHPKNENLIKGLSMIVFLVGFYFDLLAS